MRDETRVQKEASRAELKVPESHFTGLEEVRMDQGSDRWQELKGNPELPLAHRVLLCKCDKVLLPPLVQPCWGTECGE